MPKTIEVTVYRYEELSKRAKEFAHSKWSEVYSDDRSSSVASAFIYELWKLGYPTGDICWSLGCCQGDGMAFYTGGHGWDKCMNPTDDPTMERDYCDVTVIYARLRAGMPKEVQDTLDEMMKTRTFDIRITNHYGHYNHWNTMPVSIDVQDWDSLSEAETKAYGTLETAIQDDVKSVSKRLEALGYKILEDEGSEARFIEACGDNDWWFEACGKLVHE